MASCLRIALLFVLLVSGTTAQDIGLDLSDALGGDDDPTPPPVKPKDTGSDNLPDLDILDVLDFGDPKKPVDGGAEPKKPAAGGDGLDLGDALGPDLPEPEKPAVVPPKDGGTGGGSFGDGDLLDVAGGAGGAGGGDYKPDGGSSGGRAMDPANDPNGGGAADQPQDLDHLWYQFLKVLDANMPEEVHIWIANLKSVVQPLLQRALELMEVYQ